MRARASLLFASIALVACDPEPFRPSVLLITLDTTRADALGCYGAPEWATPALDGLAARGARFADARAPAPVTLPSHATLFTGVFPFQHGVRDNGTFVLADGALTLAERLKAAGYVTIAVPAAFVVDSSFGLAQGFEEYLDVEPEGLELGDEAAARTAGEVVSLALEQLAAVPEGKPFFLWVHFFDAHFPYAPPEAVRTAHPFDPAAEEPKGGKDGRKPRGGPRAAEQRHLYQLEVAYADREIARLLQGLSRFGGAEEVLTVVAGDHGEGLGEHGEGTHGLLAYDSTLHVPLLVAHRALAGGKVIEAPASLADVAPTLLGLLGLDRAGTIGADHAPLLRGEPAQEPASRPLYFENCSTWFTSGWTPLYGVVLDGRFKAIAGTKLRLFDVVEDPGETKDVAEEHPEVVDRARAILEELATATIEATRRDLDPSEQEQLGNLGYVVGAGSSKRGGVVPPGWQPKQAITPEQGIENQRRFHRASQLWQQGQKDEALELLVALAKEEPENGRYAEVLATLLVQSGRPAEALPYAQSAIELLETAAVRNTLVACLVALGRRAEAIKELELTIARFPRVLAARVTIAQQLIEEGRPREAIPHLEHFLAHFSGDAATKAQATAMLERARSSR